MKVWTGTLRSQLAVLRGARLLVAGARDRAAKTRRLARTSTTPARRAGRAGSRRAHGLTARSGGVSEPTGGWQAGELGSLLLLLAMGNRGAQAETSLPLSGRALSGWRSWRARRGDALRGRSHRSAPKLKRSRRFRLAEP